MIRVTYKGRQLKAVKGNSFGKSRIFVNGVDRGEWLGTEAAQIESAKRTIDDVDSRPFEGRWGQEWYAPGTYELNEHDHVVAPGGVCSCDYCVTRREPAAKTQNRVSIDDIVTEAKAIPQDVGAIIAPAVKKMIHTDQATGDAYVDEENQYFVIGALWAAADRRRDARIATADKELAKSYEALRAHPAVPQGASQRLAWESAMLRLFGEVADALTELVDAKVDAKAMSPEQADRIRGEANALRRAAETGVSTSLHEGLRVARSATNP